MQSEKTTIVRVFLLLNACFWLYFFVAFAGAAEPHVSNPAGHYPVDEYTFWGWSIGLRHSAYLHGFMQGAFWAQLPAALVSYAIIRGLLHNVTAEATFAGISVQGWRLVLTMMLSFGQWYLVGRFVHGIFVRRRHATAMQLR